jgi:pimeloyl-ACP methyl ester carboxylesterase
MHIYCTGTGAPALIIEAGLGSDWLAWQGIQPKLSQFTRVCTYDRSGLGWSEPRLGKRDAEAIAGQLHTLLDEAGVKRPIVLLGHSAGGFYVREYAREYPAEVAGVVLVDSTSPQQFEELPGFRSSYEAYKRGAIFNLRWEQLYVGSGWQRLTGNCHANVPKDEASMAGQYNAEMCRPEYAGAYIGEVMDVETASEQAARLTNFGNIPLLVLSKDANLKTKDMEPNTIAGLQVWEREQEALKSLSPLSWRVVARGSGHEIEHDRPDVALSEISRLIGYLRGSPAPPFGSTTTE